MHCEFSIDMQHVRRAWPGGKVGCLAGYRWDVPRTTAETHFGHSCRVESRTSSLNNSSHDVAIRAQAGLVR